MPSSLSPSIVLHRHCHRHSHARAVCFLVLSRLLPRQTQPQRTRVPSALPPALPHPPRALRRVSAATRNTTDGCEHPILELLTGTDNWGPMYRQTLDKHSGGWFPGDRYPCPAVGEQIARLLSPTDGPGLVVARRVHGSLDSFARLKLTSQSMSLSFPLPNSTSRALFFKSFFLITIIPHSLFSIGRSRCESIASTGTPLRQRGEGPS
ncbi:hypothetical protein LY76DRAFT_293881 [Colletotrichum caudatum]|nr:hypothetical protein LY76DRAFT_293881 [Colletotrichum caudatum]